MQYNNCIAMVAIGLRDENHISSESWRRVEMEMPAVCPTCLEFHFSQQQSQFSLARHYTLPFPADSPSHPRQKIV